MSDIAIEAGATGCVYHEHKGGQPCNKMCDPDQTLCPHHLLMTKIKADAKADLEAAKSKPKPPARTHRTPRGYDS